MNLLKRILGVAWMLIGPAVTIILIVSAIKNIDLNGKLDINKPLPWIIIIVVFAPIAAGLTIFGWYGLMGEYDHLPESS
ncbi:MAG TPA: hypothetical protein VGM41_19025 [Chitinophagaceae bacterium]